RTLTEMLQVVATDIPVEIVDGATIQDLEPAVAASTAQGKIIARGQRGTLSGHHGLAAVTRSDMEAGYPIEIAGAGLGFQVGFHDRAIADGQLPLAKVANVQLMFDVKSRACTIDDHL